MNKLVLFIVLMLLSAVISGCNKSSPIGSVVQENGADGVVGAVKEINVKAFQFGYDPDVIKVKKGERVRINIDNSDVLHGIRVPDLGLRGDYSLEFTADKQGEFAWYCTNMCGQGHMGMKGKLIVE